MSIICNSTNNTCHVSAEFIQKTMDALTKDKEPVVPKFIITYGPPGSGKSSMLKNAVYNNQINPQNTVEVNVDAIISGFQMYKDDLENVRRLLGQGNEAEAKNAASTAYWKYRQTGATFSDFILNMSLLQKYNVIWETTGNSINWSIHEIERIRRYGYKIIVVYPFVEIDQLIARTTLRARSELRFVDDDYIRRVSVNAQRNFMELAKHADEAYFYNNNVANPNWDPVVSFTGLAFDHKAICKSTELHNLLPKMNAVLAQDILKLCKK